MDNDFKPRQNSERTPMQRPDPTPTAVAPSSQQPVKQPQYSAPSHAEKTPKRKKPSALRELFSTIGILVTALLVALLMIMFVFRSYQVDGPSMKSTLQNGDKLIIWKVPRTWARLTGHNYIPNRGDIIVFTQSGLSQFGQDDTKQLIKRVIGLPGDRVVVKNGAYLVYNKANPSGFNPDKTLSYGKDIPETSGDIDYTLKSDQLFVSGDNRPNSLDSRTFGPIKADQVIGKLTLRAFPINKAEVF